MINQNMKDLRESKNVTQSDLAEAIGVSRDYISMIERGDRTPGFKLAKRIADYFGTTVDYLFFADESNKTFDDDTHENSA